MILLRRDPENKLGEQPILLIEEVVKPEQNAAAVAHLEGYRRNSDWLQANWAKLVPQARGKFLAVAGQEPFLGDTMRAAWALAQAAHPEDDAILCRYIRTDRGPRIYANSGSLGSR